MSRSEKNAICISLYIFDAFISFFFFWSNDQKTKKSAVIFRQNANFLYRKETNRTAEFFVFGHFDQKTKNEKWNEPDNYGK